MRNNGRNACFTYLPTLLPEFCRAELEMQRGEERKEYRKREDRNKERGRFFFKVAKIFKIFRLTNGNDTNER